MQLRYDVQIPSMIKAMAEVIAPAIDPTNELAVQQSQLLMGHMALMMQMLPLQYRADRDELDRLVAYARDIRTMQKDAQGVDTSELDAVTDRAADVLDRARAEPAELIEAIHSTTAALDGPIRALAASNDAAARNSAMRATLQLSEAQLLRARSSLLMQGWEPDPSAVPAIETLLAPVPLR